MLRGVTERTDASKFHQVHMSITAQWKAGTRFRQMQIRTTIEWQFQMAEVGHWRNFLSQQTQSLLTSPAGICVRGSPSWTEHQNQQTLAGERFVTFWEH